MTPRKMTIYTIVNQNAEVSVHARFANNVVVSSGICRGFTVDDN